MKFRISTDEPPAANVFERDKYVCQDCGWQATHDTSPDGPDRTHYAVYIGDDNGDRTALDNWETQCDDCFTPHPKAKWVATKATQLSDNIEFAILAFFPLTIVLGCIGFLIHSGWIGQLLTLLLGPGAAYLTLKACAWPDPTGRFDRLTHWIEAKAQHLM
jgi:hypothetical protein